MDEEERNYCFLILLLSRVGLPKLRDLFIKKWDSAGGFVSWKDCRQNGTDLLTKFTPLNYEKPKVQSGDTTTWDLSLFVKALLNSRPPFVPSSKKGLVAGLKCLKETRNKLCHSPNGKIENSEFCNLKSDVCNALTQVGATSKDFKKLKKDVDHQPLNELLSLVKHCASQDEEILKQIDAIKQGQEEIKQGQSDLQQGQQEIKQGQSGLQHGQQELKQGQSDLQQGQQEIKQGQSGLQQGQEEIKQGQSGLQQGQQEIKQGQSGLQQEIKQGHSDLQQEIKQGQSGLQHEIKQSQSGLQQGQQEILKAIKFQDKESISKSSNLSCEDVLSYSKRLKTSTKAQTEFQPKLLASHDVPSTRTDDIFTNLMIQREWKPLKRVELLSRRRHLQNYNKPSVKHQIDKCQDIFINPDHYESNPKSILVIGKPGIGKSLFCQRLSRDWADDVLFHKSPDVSRVAADDFDFVFLMTFRQLNLYGDEKFNFCEVLNHCSVVDDHANINEHLFEYIIGHPEKVLFILDGYDEYSNRASILQCPFEQKYENNPRLQMPVAALISKLLRKKIFKNAVVMVTSRPTAADELGGIHMDAVVEIAGFSVEQVKEFISKYFKSKKEEVKIAARDHIMNNENLLSIAHIPVLCHLMCFCLEWHIENGTEKCFPATITELYSEVVEIFEDCCKTIHRASKEKSTVKKLTDLAAAMFMEGKLIFDQRDVERFHLTCPETGNLQSFGLLTCGPAFRVRPSKMTRHYCFSHLTLYEYFAALGFVNSGIIPTLEAGDGKEMVLKFCAGLFSGVEDGERLMEEMISPYCCCKHGMLVAKCLREYGDKEFGVKIIEKYHTQFSTEKGVLFQNELPLIDSSDWIALVYFLDLVSQFYKGLVDHAIESFCINGLNIDVHQVSSSVIKQFADSLKNDGCPLTFLSINLTLFSNCSSHHILECLFPALPSTHITALHLSGRFTNEGISSLSDVLPSTHITTLHLGGLFTNEGMSSLSNVLPSTHITTLHLFSGRFIGEGISSLSDVLPSTHITTLHLASGGFTDEGISSLSNVLPSTHITTLHLDGEFTDEGISSLSNVLPSTHITTLHLSSRLTDIGMSHLHNRFTDEGISSLSSVLPSTNITTLHLSSQFTDEGISSLSNVLPSTHITTLSLLHHVFASSSSCFTDKGLFILGEVLPSTSINSLTCGPRSMKITQRCINKLRKSAPACNIRIDDTSIYYNNDNCFYFNL
ncbi:NLR family CARD domain-containing protein 3 isoform X3 [Exaiptasia diaphana]|uniref:NACHT domain-containing protein n=1 Tax=Exaiptasia diaphana TaxID=2652724 RepID=A0A913YNW0_EXADI|nr:NLR family CARD domain-containing protein 3 isoform X3 [Exaiptasia diaphana]